MAEKYTATWQQIEQAILKYAIQILDHVNEVSAEEDMNASEIKELILETKAELIKRKEISQVDGLLNNIFL